MIRLLVANGCSMTRGAELSHPGRDAWPAVLARDLGLDVVNLGCDGGSNRRVVRTTVEEIEGIRADRGLEYREILVLCMWTAVTRYERYDSRSEDRELRPDLGARPDLPEELHWHRVADWAAREGDKPSKAYYRHLCTVEGATVHFLLDWVLLERFLTGLGAPCRFMFGFHTLPDPLPPEALRLVPMLCPDLRYGELPPRPSDCLVEMLDGVAPLGPVGHPLVEGHRYYAAVVRDWLRADPRLEFPAAVADGRADGRS